MPSWKLLGRLGRCRRREWCRPSQLWQLLKLDIVSDSSVCELGAALGAARGRQPPAAAADARAARRADYARAARRADTRAARRQGRSPRGHHPRLLTAPEFAGAPAGGRLTLRDGELRHGTALARGLPRGLRPRLTMRAWLAGPQGRDRRVSERGGALGDRLARGGRARRPRRPRGRLRPRARRRAPGRRPRWC